MCVPYEREDVGQRALTTTLVSDNRNQAVTQRQRTGEPLRFLSGRASSAEDHRVHVLRSGLPNSPQPERHSPRTIVLQVVQQLAKPS